MIIRQPFILEQKSLEQDLPRVKEKETSSFRKFFDDLHAHIQILEAQGPGVACPVPVLTEGCTPYAANRCCYCLDKLQ